MRGAGVYFVLYCADFFYLPDSVPHFEIVWVCFFSYYFTLGSLFGSVRLLGIIRKASLFSLAVEKSFVSLLA